MKVLMVCLGNICRSPVAEGILRKKADELGLEIATDSAGTSSYHIGESPDRRMLKAAEINDIDISDLRARQFEQEDFDRFDIIFAMDQSNRDNILALARNEEDRQKVQMILNESQPDSDMEVPDPYFGGDDGFQHVIDLLEGAVTAFLYKHNA